MPHIDHIRSALAEHEPRLLGPAQMQAAVAMTLAHGDRGIEVLLMRRAEREGDPWSGHMSFPGGRIEPGDASTRHAAERETWEEVGVDLSSAVPLGRLDDVQGVAVPILVSAFVYELEVAPPLVLSEEVRHAFWVPLEDLLDGQRHVTESFEYQGNPIVLPAIAMGDGNGPPLWGLTYFFLEHFFRLVGRPLPETPWRE